MTFQRDASPATLWVDGTSFEGLAVIHQHVNTGDRRGYREAAFVAEMVVPVVPSDEVRLTLKHPRTEFRATVSGVNVRSNDSGVESAITLLLAEGEANEKDESFPGDGEADREMRDY